MSYFRFAGHQKKTRIYEKVVGGSQIYDKVVTPSYFRLARHAAKVRQNGDFVAFSCFRLALRSMLCYFYGGG
jgi:hypothetical protein